jgi:hypothetical protein
VRRFFLPALAIALACAPARASIQALPRKLGLETLSESVPTAFAPGNLTISDFAVEWDGAAPAGVRLSLGRESLEWVRVAETLVLPRARLRVEIDGASGGAVSSLGSFQPVAPSGPGSSAAEIPIALLSGPEDRIAIRFSRSGVIESHDVRVVFRPSPKADTVLIDPSCSPFGLKATLQGQKTSAGWVFLGCRLIHGQGDRYRTASVELLAYWDGSAAARLGDVPVEPIQPGLWSFRLRREPGFLDLVSTAPGGPALHIGYEAPDRVSLLSFGAGVGPYSYSFQAPQGSTGRVVPLVTLYGSLFITEANRLVAFDATPIASQAYTDLGVYLTNESFRALDRRVIFNLMLGAHALAFRDGPDEVTRFGAPQGFELIYRDALMSNRNASVGAFIYPPISGKLYYNAWVRWGSPSFFAEMNYLAWQEKFGDDRVYSRSFGFSVGFPLFRLF